MNSVDYKKSPKTDTKFHIILFLRYEVNSHLYKTFCKKIIQRNFGKNIFEITLYEKKFPWIFYRFLIVHEAKKNGAGRVFIFWIEELEN